MFEEFSKPMSPEELTMLELSLLPYIGVFPDVAMYYRAIKENRWFYVTGNLMCVPLNIASRFVLMNVDLGPWMKHKYAMATFLKSRE